MNIALFRCEEDKKLLRKSDCLKGACLGHKLKPATDGSVFEWVRVQFWKLTGQL